MPLESPFKWPVSANGYSVKPIAPGATGSPVSGADRPTKGHYLVPNQAGKLRVEFSTTQPLDTKGLYLKFARLPLTPNAVAAFASKHGLLGSPISATALFGRDLLDCESIAIWWEEIETLAHSIATWTHIRDGRSVDWHLVGSLGQVSTKYEIGSARHLPRRQRDAAQVAFAEVVRQVVKGRRKLGSGRTSPSVLAAALPVAHRVLEHFGYDKLGNGPANESDPRVFLTAQLARRMSSYVQALMPPRVSWNSHVGGFEITLEPRTLLGAIWAQFIRSIALSEFRRCSVCTRLMEVSLHHESGARIDKQYCGPKCRAQAARARKRGAK